MQDRGVPSITEEEFQANSLRMNPFDQKVLRHASRRKSGVLFPLLCLNGGRSCGQCSRCVISAASSTHDHPDGSTMSSSAFNNNSTNNYYGNVSMIENNLHDFAAAASSVGNNTNDSVSHEADRVLRSTTTAAVPQKQRSVSMMTSSSSATTAMMASDYSESMIQNARLRGKYAKALNSVDDILYKEK